MPQLEAIGIINDHYRTSEHQHFAWEMLYFSQGFGMIHVGNIEYEIGAYDFIMIPPRVSHFTISESGYQGIYLQFSKFNSPIPRSLICRDSEDRVVHDLLMRAHREYHLKRNNWNNITGALLSVINEYMLSWDAEARRSSFVENLEEELIENIHNKDYNINTAFDRIPLSRDYIVKLFKKETGETPLSYLTEKRINFAVQLLKSQKPRYMTIKEIAYMVGFEDQYYFSRVFKKITGKSPESYKNLG